MYICIYVRKADSLEGELEFRLTARFQAEIDLRGSTDRSVRLCPGY